MFSMLTCCLGMGVKKTVHSAIVHDVIVYRLINMLSDACYCCFSCSCHPESVRSSSWSRLEVRSAALSSRANIQQRTMPRWLALHVGRHVFGLITFLAVSGPLLVHVAN